MATSFQHTDDPRYASKLQAQVQKLDEQYDIINLVLAQGEADNYGKQSRGTFFEHHPDNTTMLNDFSTIEYMYIYIHIYIYINLGPFTSNLRFVHEANAKMKAATYVLGTWQGAVH